MNKFKLILVNPENNQVLKVYEKESLVLVDKGNGEFTVQKRITDPEVLDVYKSEAGIAFYLANYNYANYRGILSATIPTISGR